MAKYKKSGIISNKKNKIILFLLKLNYKKHRCDDYLKYKIK